MARASAASLLLLPALAAAQAFGRFGYVDVPPVPGFVLDSQGFAARFGAADKFFFPEAVNAWKVATVNEFEENVELGPDTNLKVNLLAPGFMIQMKKGFSIRLHSTSAPFLSWKEASVGENVPTPSVRWIGVSFKADQPPIVLGFLDSEVSLETQGTVGDWTIRTIKPYAGWVRVALPFGTQALGTQDAAALGRLSTAISSSSELWYQPTPALRALTVRDEQTAVEATWQFDRKGVLIPVGASMANLGYYPLTIKSRNHRLDGYTEEGPTTVCDEESLTIRFPIRRIPLGRAITVGAPENEPIATVSAFDVSGVVELALENLTAARDLRSRNTAEDTVNSLIQDGQYTVEPHTNQRLPYTADGQGADVVAANALLYQAYTMSSRATSLDNSLLTSAGWRRDWYSWRFWGADERTERRVGALCAMAGALCPEPERRLEAAMSQAGLAAERGLAIYFARLQHKPEPTMREPLWTVRNTIFDMAQTPRHPSDFAETLFGELRVFGDAPVRATSDPAGGVGLTWTDPAQITLASGFPIAAAGDQLEVRHILGYTILKSASPGDHTARLMLPSWMRPLLRFVAPPSYDELER